MVLLWAYYEKAGFFGKDDAAKKEGSKKRGKSTMRWTKSIKEATGMSLQELSRAVESRTLDIVSSWCYREWESTQQRVTQPGCGE